MRHKLTVIYILVSIFGMNLLCGCSETPEAKAAKQTREQTQKALAIVEDYKLNDGYDYALARQEVDKAAAMAAQTGGMTDEVYFASADLTSAYASKSRKAISAAQEEAAMAVQDCANAVLQMASVQSQIETVEMLMKTGANEAGELEKLLTGQKAGVAARLEAAQKQLASYESMLARYNKAADEAKAAADSIQSQADELLRAAQLKAGQERIDMERTAYSLLKGDDASDKSVFYYNALVQENLDMADTVSVQVNTVKPLIEKLTVDIDSLSKRIDELKNQDNTLDFTGQLASLKKQAAEVKEQLVEKTTSLKALIEQYQQKVAEQTALYIEAQENYARVKTQGLIENAQLKTADCSRAIAALNADTFKFAKRIADNAGHAAQITVDGIGNKAVEMNEQFKAFVEEYREKTKTAFEKAFEEYQGLIERYSNGEFADVAVRNYMTAIYSRLKFDTLSDDAAAVKESLLAKIEEIKEISIQADPSFANSKVAALFTKYGIDFKTAEQKLQESFNELKAEFAVCKDLDEEARKTKILAILEKFNQLERTADEQFYNDLVKYIYDTFRDDWLAIAEADSENETIALFKDFIARDTAPEETETVAAAANDPNNM